MSDESDGQKSREQLESELCFLREQVRRLQLVASTVADSQALSAAASRHAAILHSSLDCIVTVDHEGRILEFNPAAERTFGYGVNEVLGKPIAECIIPPSLRAAHEAGFARYLTTGHGPVLNRRIEITARRSNGHEFPVELAITPFEIDGHISFTAHIRDLSAQKQSEEALRQSQKLEAVGKLAGGIAHDFNNLMTVVLGYCDLLDGGPFTAEAVRSTSDEIRLAGQRAAELTKQLLAFSRKQRMELRSIDPNSVVEDCARMMRRVLDETIEFVLDLEAGSGPIHADANQLGQVLVNLVVNARDAMPDGGQLLLRTTNIELHPGNAPASQPSANGAYLLLEVADSGVGMTAEVLSRAFEPFYTTKPVGKGTGLGLSTAYGIVQQFGGAIDALSRPGEGTTIRIYLPRSNDPVEATDVGATSSQDLSGSGTVLLVEDDERVRSLVQRALQAGGYKVLTAPNGPAALELARSCGPDAIDVLLADMVMPEMSGPALAEHLRRARPGIAVMFMSGYSEFSTRSFGQSDGYLQKPFTAPTLLKALRERLQARRRTTP